jgi:hypothetical protein
MNKTLRAVSFSVLVPAAAAAQDPTPVEQSQEEYSFQLKIDALTRYEWTRDIFVAPDSFRNEDRWRLRLQPRFEAGFGPVLVGVGGDFNYSRDENNEPRPTIQRDNYDSRDARLDLAFGRLTLGPLRAQGGRFPMPVPLTEMLWDRDLRPQGGAATLELRDMGTAVKSLGATAVYSRGGHVFDDGTTTLLLLSGEMTFTSPSGSELQLLGSFLEYTKFDGAEPLEPMLRRQNTASVSGAVAGPFEVVDLIARFRHQGQAPLQLVGDYCWNRALDSENKGLWLAVVLGAIKTTPARLEYTYAKVDRNATLAAYASDDFFWSTGWQGHRADLGIRAGEHSSLHTVGQLQRFKDSPRVEERDHWVKRIRIEWRISK